MARAAEPVPPLSAAQKAWLAEPAHRVLRYCFNANWRPFDYSEAGQHHGIFRDYLDVLSQRLGVRFEPYPTPAWTDALEAVKRGDCDFLSGAVRTPEREQFLNFTAPYFQMNNVLVAKPDKPFLGDLNSLNGKRISGPKSGAIMNWLAKEYPEIELVPIVTPSEALSVVLDDKVYAHVAPLEAFVADYQWQMHNLKIIGKLDFPYPISVAVRKDQAELQGLLAWAVQSLGEADHARIRSKYQSFTVVEEVNYRKLAAIVAVALLLITVLYVYNRRLRREIVRREQAEAELRHLAHHDALTGLPSMRYALERIELALQRSRRSGTPVGLLFLDLDGFKAVNDRLGHGAGDALLKRAAEVLRAQLRESDLAARIGGDEFIVLVEDCSAPNAVDLVANKVRQALHFELDAGEQTLLVTPSIGMALYPAHAKDAGTLIQAADAAMYQAKRGGKNRAAWATPSTDV